VLTDDLGVFVSADGFGVCSIVVVCDEFLELISHETVDGSCWCELVLRYN
jgi:hypothetical protein